MTQTPPKPHHPRAARSTLPPTLWLPGPDQPHAAPTPGHVLPQWAIDKIRTEIVPRPGNRPSPLLGVRVDHAGPGMDAQARTAAYTDPDGNDPAEPGTAVPLLLAEIHPDTLTTSGYGTPAPLSQSPPAAEETWPGFFHRAHRLLPPEGLLLIATRQRRDEGELTDPLGELIACARTAGFAYLQHIAVIHAHPVADRLIPQPGEDLPPGLIHSDLLILSPITHA